MADRYWRGGTGTWSTTNTTNWSTTSGGSGGASVPGTADRAIFNAASSGASYTVTRTATTQVQGISLSGPSSGTLTFAGTAVLPVGTAGVVLGSNFSWTLNGELQFLATGNFDGSGRTIASPIRINGTGITVTFLNDITTTGIFTLQAGTLNLDGNDITSLAFASNNTNTRTFAFGTGGRVFVTGNDQVVFSLTGSGLTVTGTGAREVNLTYSGSTGTRTVNTVVVPEANTVDLNVTAGSDTVTFAATTTTRNLIFTGFSGTWTNTGQTAFGNVTTSTGMSVGAGANALTLGGTGSTQVITSNGKTFDFPITINGSSTKQLTGALTVGPTRLVALTSSTLNLNNNNLTCGLFQSNSSDTRTLAFGTGQIFVTSNGVFVWIAGVNGTYTITGTNPTVNATYSGATGTRGIAHFNDNNPVNAKSVNFNVTAGTDIVQLYGQSLKSVNFTGFSGTWSNVGGKRFFGGMVLSTGMTIESSADVNDPWRFIAPSGTQTINLAGKTINYSMEFDGAAGTWQFSGALTQGSTYYFDMVAGTVTFASGTTNTVGIFESLSATVKFLRSSTPGTRAFISQASGTVYAFALDVRDSYATGGAVWDAINPTNIDSGNNLGWGFSSMQPFLFFY